MNYVLTFSMKTAGYRCHAKGCSAAVNTKHTALIPTQFSTVDAARNFANADESEKSGEVTKANFRVCNCARNVA
jgi:hypothetical protein